jgi:hypothetical protein
MIWVLADLCEYAELDTHANRSQYGRVLVVFFRTRMYDSCLLSTAKCDPIMGILKISRCNRDSPSQRLE